MPSHPSRPRAPQALLTLLLASGLGFAETPQPAEATLGTVRVTAQAAQEAPSEESGAYTTTRSTAATKLDLPLRETPQAISVVTRARIEDFQLSSVNTLLDTVPGINVERVETDRTYYSARGFDITNLQVDGLGVPMIFGNQYGDIDTALYDRVEVIKGANGLISATGSPSATVNFVRKRPTRDFQASGSLSAGSWDRLRLELDLSSKLNASGSVRGRFVGAAEGGDSYLDRYSDRKTAFSGIIEADLSPDTTLALGALRQEKNTHGGLWGGLPLYYSDGSATHYDRSTSTATDWVRWNTLDTQLFGELSHHLSGDWELKATFTHRNQALDDKLFYVYGTPDVSTGLGLYAYPSLYLGKIVQNTLDASLNGRYNLLGRQHQVAFGVQYSHANQDGLSHYGQGIGTALPDLATWDGKYAEPGWDAYTDDSRYTDKRKSVYLATHLNLSERWKLLLGTSATTLETRGYSYGVSSERSGSAFTPYLGLTYNLTPAATLYASYARIFDPQSQVDRSLQRLDPVEGRSYELGLKNEWLGKRLNTTVSVFRIEQDNLAEFDQYVGTTSTYKGVDTVSRGLELEASGELTEHLQGSAGFTVLSIQDPDGQSARTYVPRRTAQASLTYHLPGLEQLKVGASALYKSGMWRDQGSGITTRQQAYTLLNLMARYEFTKSWSAGVQINNVTDVKYINSLYWSQGFYGAPTSYTASLSWKY